MQLDSLTVLFGSAAVLAALSVQLLYFWLRDRDSLWLLWWVGPFALAAVSAILFSQRDVWPDMATIAAANSCLFLAYGVAWQGIRAFERRPPLMIAGTLPAAIWFLACFVPQFMEYLPARMMSASLVVGGYCFLMARELQKGRAESLPSRLPAIAIFVSLGLFQFIRIPLMGHLPFPLGVLPMSGNWFGFYTLVSSFHVASLVVLLVAMTKERREQTQQRMAESDALTGLRNRRAFALDAASVLERHGATRSPVAVLVFDLDHFKTINDKYGHEAGDSVLVQFGAILRDSVRREDLLYRMGGEEFCCIFPGMTGRNARSIADRMRHHVARTPFGNIDAPILVTVSVGVASSELSGYDIDALMAVADAALYDAKAEGRNRVMLGGEVVYHPTVRVTRHYSA